MIIMNNQKKADFEGLTIKVECQVVDVTYHGVSIPVKGNGILGQMIDQYLPKNGERNAAMQQKTTVSEIAMQIPTDSITSSIAKKIGAFRAEQIVLNRTLTQKVRTFHEALHQFKRQLLNGKTENIVDANDLERLKVQMEPYNVGKVMKVKLRARLFTKDEIPGFNAVKSGGYSLTRVLYTFYLPIDGDLEANAKALADKLSKYEYKDNLIVDQPKAKVILEDEDRIIIQPIVSDTLIRMKTNTGTNIDISVEEVLNGRKSTAFGNRKK